MGRAGQALTEAGQCRAGPKRLGPLNALTEMLNYYWEAFSTRFALKLNKFYFFMQQRVKLSF